MTAHRRHRVAKVGQAVLHLQLRQILRLQPGRRIDIDHRRAPPGALLDHTGNYRNVTRML